MKAIGNFSVLVFFVGASPWEAFAQTVDESQAVVVIEVPVQVSSRGKPVRGLTVENFSVYDNGEPQQILSFEVIDHARTESEPKAEADAGNVPREPASPKPRHFLFFFDLYFSSRFTTRRAIDSAREFIEKMDSGDKVAVTLFSPSTGILLLEGFTTDRDVLSQVMVSIEKLLNPWRKIRYKGQASDSPAMSLGTGTPPWFGATKLIGPGERFGLLLNDSLASGHRALANLGDRNPEAAFLRKKLDSLAELKHIGTPTASSNAILHMAHDLALLTHALKSVEGGKYLVLLSEGYSNGLLLNGPYSGMVQSQLRKMFDVVRQTGWAFHTIDIRGVRPGGFGAIPDGLYQLARDTGGKFYQNYNDINKAINRVVEDTSLTYLLGFQPRELVLDGSYHRIRVTLEGVNFRTSIRYSRPGYFAPMAARRN